MSKLRILIFAAFAGVSHALPAGAQTLDEISKFAAEQCENVLKGDVSRSELEGKLNGKIIPFLEKFGAEGDGTVKKF